MSDVFELAKNERMRQIDGEGFSLIRDDGYSNRELAYAAASYAIGGINFWPWSPSWWKPSGEKRNIVKAMALLAAEYERIERIEIRKADDDTCLDEMRNLKDGWRLASDSPDTNRKVKVAFDDGSTGPGIIGFYDGLSRDGSVKCWWLMLGGKKVERAVDGEVFAWKEVQP